MKIHKVLPFFCLVLLLLAACGPEVAPTALRPPTSVPRTEVVPTPGPDLSSMPEVTLQGELEGGVPFGVTAEGHPFKGDPKAPVVLYEFSDYQ